jgi:hypothetical protein
MFMYRNLGITLYLCPQVDLSLAKNFLRFFERSDQLNVTIFIMENQVKTCSQVFRLPSNLSY